MNIYSLLHYWYKFVGENASKVKIQHHAVYFYAIYVANKNGWAKEFVFPSISGLTYSSVRTYKTYIRAFKDLISFGFIELIQKSTNQETANIIALVDFDQSDDKSITISADKAIYNARLTQRLMQRLMQDQRNSSVYKLLYNILLDYKTGEIGMISKLFKNIPQINIEEYLKDFFEINEVKLFLLERYILKKQALPEKEKSSAKKEKPHSAVFNNCKAIFLGKNETYYWQSEDDKHLSQILTMLSHSIGKSRTEQKLQESFQFFIENLPKYWIEKKFTIPNLSKNYNEIINEIKRNYERKEPEAGTNEKFGRHSSQVIIDLAKNFGK